MNLFHIDNEKDRAKKIGLVITYHAISILYTTLKLFRV